MACSIKEIARLANVSTRTIRYYDEIGLLPPARIGDNGYRYYDRRSLLALQQILFFRELEIPLKDIADFMAMHEFNPMTALENHRKALKNKVSRMEKLIKTIDNTVSMLKGDAHMAENELFSGFDEEKYAEETKERWGHTEAYKDSQQRWKSYSNAQKEAIKEEGGEITLRMVGTDPGLAPSDPGVQKAVADYLAYLNKYFYSCDEEFLRGLSEMWVADARYAINYERIREGGAEFVKNAVAIFCDNQE